jgi:Phage tail repeat like
MSNRKISQFQMLTVLNGLEQAAVIYGNENYRVTLNAIAALVTKTMIGLGNVDNTTDLTKPLSIATVNALINKADVNHAHNYTVSDIVGLLDVLATKANMSHNHPMTQIDGLDTALAGKSAIAHNHALAEVVGLIDALVGKANLLHNHTQSEVSGLTTTIADIFALIATLQSQITGLSGGSSVTFFSGTPSASNIYPNPGEILEAAKGDHSHPIQQIRIPYTVDLTPTPVDNFDGGYILDNVFRTHKFYIPFDCFIVSAKITTEYPVLGDQGLDQIEVLLKEVSGMYQTDVSYNTDPVTGELLLAPTYLNIGKLIIPTGYSQSRNPNAIAFNSEPLENVPYPRFLNSDKELHAIVTSRVPGQESFLKIRNLKLHLLLLDATTVGPTGQ